MDISGNPANRLLMILNEAKDICERSCNILTNINLEVKDVWAKVFNIREDDDEKIFLGIVQVIKQIEIIKEAIDKIESNSKCELIKSTIELEKKIMNMKLNDSYRIISQVLTEESLTAIRGISFALDCRNQYCFVKEEELIEFRNKIESLKTELDELKLTEEIRSIIIENLNNIYSMIEDYKLYGTEGIKASAQKGYGKILLSKSISEEVSKNSEFNKFIHKNLALFASVNTAVTFSKNVAPVLSEGINHLKNYFIK